MRSWRRDFHRRLSHLEFCQREEEFKELAGLLANYRDLSEAQCALIMPRLERLFKEELAAGVPLEESLNKLPEALKLDVYRQLVATGSENA